MYYLTVMRIWTMITAAKLFWLGNMFICSKEEHLWIEYSIPDDPFLEERGATSMVAKYLQHRWEIWQIPGVRHDGQNWTTLET